MKCVLTALVFLLSAFLPARGSDLYVSPGGKDTWSGKLAEPAADGKDGPLATIPTALKIALELRKDQAVTIRLRGGTYFLDAPLLLTGESSTSAPANDNRGRRPKGGGRLTVESFDPAPAVLSGGRRITGFREQQVNGRTAWTVVLPEVKAGTWYFRQLWVNAQRRDRARLPREGLFDIDSKRQKRTGWGGTDTFAFRKGQLRADWRNLQDVELSIFHVWLNSQLPVKSVDEQKLEVLCQYPTAFGGLDPASFFVDNVFEAMTQPGQWYLDRPTGTLYYLPMPGETIEKAEVIAPVLTQIMVIGEAGEDTPVVQNVHFVNVVFSHNEHRMGFRKSRPTAQAAWDVPGAVSLHRARNVTFRNCRFEHTGTYGLELADKTWEVALERCTLRDLGAGGVKIWHGCERTLVSDCEIADGGHVYHDGVGVLIGRASGTRILHNDIHDFDYSGISSGWNWGPGENLYGNVYEGNRIHHVGRRMLSDLAGIYFLGKQNGTRVRFNVIHDVYCRVYGGWGLYGDGWASGILFDRNLIYNTTTGAFHTNVGVDIEFDSNIFAFGKLHQLSYDYPNAAHEVLLRRTIILSDGQNFTNKDWAAMKNVTARDNIAWDLRGQRPKDELAKGLGAAVIDPGFVDPRKGDFRLRPDSPALKMGFIPFDHTKAGPRPPIGPAKGEPE